MGGRTLPLPLFHVCPCDPDLEPDDLSDAPSDRSWSVHPDVPLHDGTSGTAGPDAARRVRKRDAGIGVSTDVAHTLVACAPPAVLRQPADGPDSAWAQDSRVPRPERGAQDTADVPTVWSLFAGQGGFDLGLERAGMRVVAQMENHPAANKILAAHWPDVPNYGDVVQVARTLTEGGDAARTLPRAHLLCGGFPCQDLSVAGLRKGLAGARSGLFFDAARIIEALHPQWVVLENVPGLLSSGKREGDCATATSGRCDTHPSGCVVPGKDMGAVLDTLVSIGYEDLSWRVLDSLNMGVPQRRRRVIILGHLGPASGRVTRKALLDCEGTPWRPPAARGAAAPTAEPTLFGDNEPSWRAYTRFCPPTTVGTWSADNIDLKWPTSGTRDADGGWSTPAASESPFDAGEWVLSDILEPEPVPEEFYLGWVAAIGVLIRAVRRGKTLPHSLEWALADTVCAAPEHPLGDRIAAALARSEPGGSEDAGTVVDGHRTLGARIAHTAVREGPGTLIAALAGNFVRPGRTVTRAVPRLPGTVGSLTAWGVGVAGVDDNQAHAGHVFAPLPLDQDGQDVANTVPAHHPRNAPDDTLYAPALTSRYHKGPGSSADDALICPPTAATLTAGASSPSVSAPGRRQEDDTNLVPVGAPAADRSGDDVAGTDVFRKQSRARHSDDDETWVVGEHANTLNAHDVGETRTTHAVVSPTSSPAPDSGDGAGEEVADDDRSSTRPHARVRRLTVIEVERLQGVPDGWTEPAGSNSARYARVGNAVTVQVAEFVGARIVAYERGELT